MVDWLPKAEWQALMRGEGCPICKDMHVDANEYSFLVTELRQTYVRFSRNQYMRGWTVLILKHHASELFELDDTTLTEFWQDVRQVAQALDAMYEPAKVNYGVFGNRCPHIHCHVLLQFYDDDPHAPIDMNRETHLLTDDEYRQAVAALREQIANYA